MCGDLVWILVTLHEFVMTLHECGNLVWMYGDLIWMFDDLTYMNDWWSFRVDAANEYYDGDKDNDKEDGLLSDIWCWNLETNCINFCACDSLGNTSLLSVLLSYYHYYVNYLYYCY